MNICAVIPAAGLGSRLGMNIPKILTPITANETVWTILRKKLFPLVDHIHVVVSPNHLPIIHHTLKNDIRRGLVSLSIQQNPVGMGDAIFCGYSTWSKANTLLVIWGDQVHVSALTIERALENHAGSPKTIALPLTKIASPYVEYIFDDYKRLVKILQSREGDYCNPYGWSDVGTFVLSTESLLVEWNTYLQMNPHGNTTNEINFLPFLPFLTAREWLIKKIIVTDAIEARGINTKEDLLFFQSIYGECVT